MSRRVIWITGGSSGIGKAAVRKFAGTGDRVAFTFLHSEAAARALESETGGRVGFGAGQSRAGRDSESIWENRRAGLRRRRRGKGACDGSDGRGV